MIGPPFSEVIKRYDNLETRISYLTHQIQNGSKGVWGEVHAMPAHSYLETTQVEQMIDAIFKLEVIEHAARNREVQLETPPSPSYPGSGPGELVDGIRGSETDLKNDWLGFNGDNLTATIDLGEETTIHHLGLSSCQVVTAGVFLPTEVEFLVSNDGKQFHSIASLTHEVAQKEPTHKALLSSTIKETRARFVRVKATNLGTIPDWHQAKGRKAWLFVDEIIVNGKE